MLTVESSLELFRTLFPLMDIHVGDDEMRYFLLTRGRVKYWEEIALRIIMSNKLPLEVTVEEWSSRRGVRYELVVKHVPEVEDIPAY